MRKPLLTLLLFVTFQLGEIGNYALTPQLAATLPTLDRLIKVGRLGAVIHEGESAYIYIWMPPRTPAALERLVERVRQALGSDPENEVARIRGMYVVGSFDGTAEQPEDILYVGHVVLP